MGISLGRGRRRRAGCVSCASVHCLENDLIVENPVLVTLVRLELHCESSEIADGIGRTFFRSNGRYPRKNFTLFANAIQEVGVSDV
jgi:hypothetical protein